MRIRTSESDIRDALNIFALTVVMLLALGASMWFGGWIWGTIPIWRVGR